MSTPVVALLAVGRMEVRSVLVEPDHAPNELTHGPTKSMTMVASLLKAVIDSTVDFSSRASEILLPAGVETTTSARPERRLHVTRLVIVVTDWKPRVTVAKVGAAAVPEMSPTPALELKTRPHSAVTARPTTPATTTTTPASAAPTPASAAPTPASAEPTTPASTRPTPIVRSRSD